MSQDDTNRGKLARLADALIDDIMKVPDVDIVAEVGRPGIERTHVILIEAKAAVSRRRLTQAKHELQAWRAAQSQERDLLDRAVARDLFEKIRNADPAFNQKIMMAARNGEEPTDRDKEGLIEDWADLQKLDEQDTLE